MTWNLGNLQDYTKRWEKGRLYQPAITRGWIETVAACIALYIHIKSTLIINNDQKRINNLQQLSRNLFLTLDF